MRVLFGWHLDGSTYPETISQRKAVLGEYICGPQGLIDVLQTHLGLSFKPASLAVRIAQYSARLKELDDGNRFYSRSFEVDGWSTAARILSWRDALVSAGWSGQEIEESDRISTIAKLEKLSDFPLSRSSADGLLDVINAIRSGRTVCSRIKEIQTVTAENLLPPLWRELLSRLRDSGIAINHLPISGKANSCDLASIQNCLDGTCRQPLAGDGSVVLIEADDEIQASEATAAWLKEHSEEDGSLVIIRGVGTSLLDEACHRLNLPRVGGETKSRWRGAMQVLPLMLDNSWLPFNPIVLIEMLSLRQAPIRRYIAHHFAGALQKEPGLGGHEWQSAWKRAEQARLDVLIKGGKTEAEAQESLARDMQEWKSWLEPQRFDQESGIPTDQVLKLCAQVQRWALSRKDTADGELLLKSAEEAASLSNALSATKLTTISKVQLDRIMDSVCGEGFALPGAGAEASFWTPLDHPGQIWSGADTVLWWGFVGSQKPAQRLIWTDAERSQLSLKGIETDPPYLPILRDAQGWRNPILNARRQLILVAPRSVAGERTASHPVFHEFSDLFPQKRDPACDAIIYRADSILDMAAVSFAGKVLTRQPVNFFGLPSSTRLWNVTKAAIKRRQRESASSLERLFGCPLSWTMRYQMNIQPSVMRLEPAGERLKGTLAHAVFDALFTEKQNWDAQEAGKRASELVETLTPAIAAPLLLPGFTIEYYRLKSSIAESVEQFVKYIQRAGLKVIECEGERSAPFGCGQLIGRTDVTLADDSGNQYVIDLKWSYTEKGRADEIAQGRPLQLAVYSWLHAHAADRSHLPLAPAGYYMIKQRQMFFTADEIFPGSSYVQGRLLDEVWKELVSTYEDSMAHLERGDVVATGINDPAVQPITYGLASIKPPCEFCDYGRLCGKKELV